ncbi:hypothetical protein O181_120856, partial [Austropuccinia psidii MF-1]|nr:hypothetical protein [Austropuccinia psidii MF-1]
MFFSGLPNELPPFLYLIDDHMPSIHHKFNTEQHHINWIARHFRPHNKQTAATCSAYNWWISVLRENAMIQGLPSNSNLASNVYVLPHLLTTKLFCEKLQEIFGDKFEGENAKRALQLDLTEQTRCDLYKAGLNVKILDVALRQEDWSKAETLAEYQHIAIISAQVSNELSELRTNHFPRLAAPTVNKPIHNPIPTNRAPLPMDLDAVSTSNINPQQYFCQLCPIKGLCFKYHKTSILLKDYHRFKSQPLMYPPPTSSKILQAEAEGFVDLLPVSTAFLPTEDPLLANLAFQEVWEQLTETIEEPLPLHAISTLTLPCFDPAQLNVQFFITHMNGTIAHGTALIDT